MNRKMLKFPFLFLMIECLIFNSWALFPKRDYIDDTIKELTNERTCWWKEVCKEEFQPQFRCRCARWSVCRGPGKYYDAYCSITKTGYIWVQPEEKKR